MANITNLQEVLSLDVPANKLVLLPFQAVTRGGATPQPFGGSTRDRPSSGQIWPRGEWQSDQTVGANLPQPPALAATVTVTPAEASVDVSGGSPTQQLTAVVKDSNGVVMTGVTIQWVSLDTSKATVDQTGLVTAVAVGDVTISAVCQGKVGQALIHVFASPPAVNSVTVTPNPFAFGPPGATQQMSATLRDASGNILTGRTITWDTDNHPVATVNGSGLVTAVAAGTFNVTATSGGKTGSAAGTVLRGPDVTNPVLYYPCDETQTTITSTGRVKDTLTEFCVDASVVGKRGNARTQKNVFINANVGFASPTVDFFGTRDVILGGSSSWSLALWFNPGLGFWSVVHSPTSVGGWFSLLFTLGNTNPSISFLFRDEGVQLDGSRPRYLEFNAPAPYGTIITKEFTTISSAWHHFAVVNDVTSGQMRVYLDGVVIYTGNAVLLGSVGDYNGVGFGAAAASLSGGTSSAAGAIDEIYLFDRALTGPEIALLVGI